MVNVAISSSSSSTATTTTTATTATTRNRIPWAQCFGWKEEKSYITQYINCVWQAVLSQSWSMNKSFPGSLKINSGAYHIFRFSFSTPEVLSGKQGMDNKHPGSFWWFLRFRNHCSRRQHPSSHNCPQLQERPFLKTFPFNQLLPSTSSNSLKVN